MDALFELIIKTYGLVGLLIAAPFVAAVYLWRDNVKIRTDYSSAISTLHASHANIIAALNSERHKELVEANAERLKQLSESNDKVVKAQEQRVADAQAVRDKLVDMISEQAAMNRETNVVLDRVGDFLATKQNRLLPPERE